MDAFSVKLKQSISHKRGVKVLTKRLCHPLPGLALALTAVPGTDCWYDEPENLKRNNQLKDWQVNGIQSNVIFSGDDFQNRFSGSCSDLKFCHLSWPSGMTQNVPDCKAWFMHNKYTSCNPPWILQTTKAENQILSMLSKEHRSISCYLDKLKFFGFYKQVQACSSFGSQGNNWCAKILRKRIK